MRGEGSPSPAEMMDEKAPSEYWPDVRQKHMRKDSKIRLVRTIHGTHGSAAYNTKSVTIFVPIIKSWLPSGLHDSFKHGSLSHTRFAI